jgi:hypothetical protein
MNHEEHALLDQAARLPREIPPERDLWPSIENEIRRFPSRTGTGWRRHTPLALAASLLLALALGYSLGRVETSDPQMTADQTPVISTEPSGYQPSGYQSVSLTRAVGLDEARRTMAAEVESGLHGLPPDARSVVLENLSVINAALDNIDRVLAETPESGLERQLLISMYADQLALLGGVRNLVLQTNRETLL